MAPNQLSSRIHEKYEIYSIGCSLVSIPPQPPTLLQIRWLSFALISSASSSSSLPGCILPLQILRRFCILSDLPILQLNLQIKTSSINHFLENYALPEQYQNGQIIHKSFLN